MGLHDEAHRDYFQHHFNTEDDQKDSVESLDDGIGLLQARILDRQADAVSEYGQQDELVEPRIENYLHNRTAESTCSCAATERGIGEVLGLVLLDHLRQVLLLYDRLC